MRLYSETVPTSLLQYISDRSASLSRSERRVADYVVEHREEVVQSTLAALASAIGVSEPTVIRFCSTLGFSGFQDFRLQMTRFLALGVPATHSAIEESDSSQTIVSKIFDHTISSFDHTRRSFEADQAVAAVDLIEAAQRLHFFGFGASSIIAKDAQQKAPLFGRPCTAESDPHQQFIEAATSDGDDLFILISHTGRTLPLPQIAEEVHANGGKVVAITANRSSPLARAADVVLVTESLEDTDMYTPTISRLAGLVVVDILATVTAMRSDSVDLARLRGMKQKLAGFRATLDPHAGEQGDGPEQGADRDPAQSDAPETRAESA
ncbi:MurR/RpiR family transcriptional regulator [Leucobacter sp. CSA1]|uniref:MurR/RpiR family transcriptional regulator n=1 Tax=Leucobacter chromiisoli TaxID=2796471 RepID=A0A934Q6P8_9MICO|nr:MurR/RpiR family transcriptional regulator [Leucobacter chromiisoli]MBK0418375.1 MurR/RpiR family transcriptional regulator [Leucobacter chromiisoli]